jgi:hypothetical protein
MRLIINCGNGKTLRLKSDEHIRYADVVSGRVDMTMVMKVT